MRQHTYIYIYICALPLMRPINVCIMQIHQICLLCGLTLVLLDGDEAVSSST